MALVFSMADLAAHPKNDFAGAKSANRFLKRVREMARGVHQEDKNLWLVKWHLDITNLAKAEFDWRGWLAARTSFNEYIIGPGITRIMVATFLDCATQYRMGRMDFLLVRVDGAAIRLHPEKTAKRPTRCHGYRWTHSG